MFPSPSHCCTLRCRGPAHSLHCHPRQEPPAFSLGAGWICRYPSTVPAAPSSHGSVTSSPSHASLSFSSPSPWSRCGEGWRLPVLLEGRGMAGWCAACTLRPCGRWCVLTVLVRAPRSAPDWCRACVTLCHAADQANPGAHRCAVKAGHGCPRRVIWTFGLFLFSRALSSPLPGCEALAHRALCATVTWALLSRPLCPSFLLGHGMVGGLEGPSSGRAVSCARLLQDCPCAWHGAGRSSCPSQPCL